MSPGPQGSAIACAPVRCEVLPRLPPLAPPWELKTSPNVAGAVADRMILRPAATLAAIHHVLLRSAIELSFQTGLPALGEGGVQFLVAPLPQTLCRCRARPS